MPVPLPFVLDFVDSIASSPTVRLSLVGDKPWRTIVPGTDFGEARLDRAISDTLLADGAHISASAYANRVITLKLRVQGTDPDAFATAVQNLGRELDRTRNFLRYQPRTTAPVFFRTFRSDFTDIDADPVSRTMSASLLAEPFAYGLKQTSAATLYFDPAEGLTLNANPFFETNATGWTGAGGTAVRSTAQFHEGAASLLLTPDGVTANTRAAADQITTGITAGLTYRASAWVRCAVSRNVNVQILWADAAGGALSTSSTTVAVTAATWTLLDMTATAPALATRATLRFEMTGTPPAGNTLHIDEARLRRPGTSGGSFLDITGVKGDVETPLMLTAKFNSGGSFDRYMVIGTRRRGTPDNAPVVTQAEAFNQILADTTTQPNATDASGSGNNFTRTTFATNPTIMATRLHSNGPFPAAASVDVRGQYRVLIRGRQTIAGDTVTVRFDWGSSPAVSSSTVTWPKMTNWAWVDVGMLSIPRGADPVTDGFSGTELSAYGSQLQILAARTAGSGNLDLDQVVLVPADDQYMTVFIPVTSSAKIRLDGTNRAAYVIDDATGAVSAPTVTGVPSLPGGASQINVSPNVTNRLYFVFGVGGTTSNPAESVNAAAVPVTVDYWPRYTNIAGPST